MSREPTLYVRTPEHIGDVRPATRRDLLAGLGLLCPTCHGTRTVEDYGADPNEHVLWPPDVACPTCGGHGYNPETVERLSGVIRKGLQDNDGADLLAAMLVVSLLDALQEEHRE